MSENLLVVNQDVRPNPNRADALKNRALLLETAHRLFMEQGVDNVSMSAVAEAAGVGKGTLYRHFTNKTELCIALLDQNQRALQERSFAFLREESDPQVALHWFIGEVAAYVNEYRTWLLIAPTSQGVHGLTHPAHLWWRLTIRSLFERGGMQGDIDYAADNVYVLLSPHTIAFQRDMLHYSMERITQGICRVVDQWFRG